MYSPCLWWLTGPADPHTAAAAAAGVDLVGAAGVHVTPEDILHTPFASLAAFKQQQELRKQQTEGQGQAEAQAPGCS